MYSSYIMYAFKESFMYISCTSMFIILNAWTFRWWPDSWYNVTFSL